MHSASSQPRFDKPPLDILHHILKGTISMTSGYVDMAEPSRLALTASKESRDIMMWRALAVKERVIGN